MPSTKARLARAVAAYVSSLTVVGGGWTLPRPSQPPRPVAALLAELSPWPQGETETWDRKPMESLDDYQRRIERARSAPARGPRDAQDQRKPAETEEEVGE
jgi:hypothetical protein